MISAAKPKIADYPFTTLVPNLGVVHLGDDYEFSDFIVADIPGLIEGASQGKGLGHEFLRHIERAEALLVLIDLSDQALIDPATQLEVLIREITAYMPELAERPRLVVGSKIDVTSTSKVDQFMADGLLDLAVSSTINQGIKELVNQLYLMVKDAKSSVPAPTDEIVIHRPTASGFDLIRDPDGVVRVIGRAAERSVALSNIGSPEALDYIQARLTKLGVNRALRRMGVREGDEVRIGAFSFDYQHDE
jgi:GTP-binding protein